MKNANVDGSSLACPGGYVDNRDFLAFRRRPTFGKTSSASRLCQGKGRTPCMAWKNSENSSDLSVLNHWAAIPPYGQTQPHAIKSASPENDRPLHAISEVQDDMTARTARKSCAARKAPVGTSALSPCWIGCWRRHHCRVFVNFDRHRVRQGGLRDVSAGGSNQMGSPRQPCHVRGNRSSKIGVTVAHVVADLHQRAGFSDCLAGSGTCSSLHAPALPK